MADALTTQNDQYSYQILSFIEFAELYRIQCQASCENGFCVESKHKVKLFELTLPWLEATEKFMLPEYSQVKVHCLYHVKKDSGAELIIAWPLIHSNRAKKISSLSSFYSSVAEPIFFTTASKSALKQLFTFINQNNQWCSMHLGFFEQGIVTRALEEHFPYQRLFGKSDNIYQTGIKDYVSYYQQRPSKLRNTIKRREKKLNQSHLYHTQIITDVGDFPAAFTAYKTIYQQSWKGNEFSFEFIERVCLAALAENKLRMGLLFIDDEPAAAQLWFLQAGLLENNEIHTTASIFKLAYNPKYQTFSVGSILSLVLSEFVITQDQVQTIEFGMGSEPYKKDWLSEQRSRQSYRVFNPDNFHGKLAIIRNILLPRLVSFLTRKTYK